MNRNEKQELVKQLKIDIDKASSAVFIDYSGLKTEVVDGLRRKIARLGGVVRIAKNTLIRRATQEKVDLTGQTAVVLSFEDPLAPVKTVVDFEKDLGRDSIKGGIFESRLVSPTEILELSRIPGREALLGTFAGMLVSPLHQFISLVTGTGYYFTAAIRELAKIKERQEKGGA